MDRAVAGAVPHVRDAAAGEVNEAWKCKNDAGPVPAVRNGVNGSSMPDQNKPNNLRLALILGSIALVFFVAVIAKRIWFS